MLLKNYVFLPSQRMRGAHKLNHKNARRWVRAESYPNVVDSAFMRFHKFDVVDMMTPVTRASLLTHINLIRIVARVRIEIESRELFLPQRESFLIERTLIWINHKINSFLDRAIHWALAHRSIVWWENWKIGIEIESLLSSSFQLRTEEWDC